MTTEDAKRLDEIQKDVRVLMKEAVAIISHHITDKNYQALADVGAHFDYKTGKISSNSRVGFFVKGPGWMDHHGCGTHVDLENCELLWSADVDEAEQRIPAMRKKMGVK